MNSADLYRVESVETTTPPAGQAQDGWCRYVVANCRSRVVGRYRGTLAQTRRNAEKLATSINERARDNRSAWAPRAQPKRKPRRARKAATR
jgi:hypothetical protein